MQSLRQVSALEGLDQLGNPLYPEADSLADVPGLENYLDLLFSSAKSQNEVVIEDAPLAVPSINEVRLTHFRQQIASITQAERQLFEQIGSTAADPAVPVYERRFRKVENHMSQLTQQMNNQELQNQAAALRQELDIQRASVGQHKDKLQQLHKLLASREQERRKKLETRRQPGWTDVRKAMAKEGASAEQKPSQREATLKEKLEEGRRAYAALEDKFRMALTVATARFSKTQDLSRGPKTVKKDKEPLLSQLTAQVSLIDGLAAEKDVCGQELAKQGTSPAEDCGRLEARIEALTTELERQKKQTEKDADALKIRSKIINDQTETIRKLKEGWQERDEQIRRLREEVVQARRKLQQKLEEDTAQEADLRECLQHLCVHKVKLKQQLVDKEAELEEVKKKYSDSNKTWHEKAAMLTQLESQVKRMRENFDTRLLEER